MWLLRRRVRFGQGKGRVTQPKGKKMVPGQPLPELSGHLVAPDGPWPLRNPYILHNPLIQFFLYPLNPLKKIVAVCSCSST